MEYPISVQLLIKTQNNKEQFIVSEKLEDAESLVFSHEGNFHSFMIENTEHEESGFQVELFFDCLGDFKTNKAIFECFNGIYVETLDGKLEELKANVEITEIAELGDFETVFYDPVSLAPLND